MVDLSHEIEDGMITYEGLPGPAICDFWTREESAARYDDGATFQIGRIDMVANTGTYVDAPFHRFAQGDDFATLALEKLAALPGLVVRAADTQAIGPEALDGLELAGKAVLFATGWSRHWRTPFYSKGHPFLTEAAARRLLAAGAALAGIDSYNIDDTRGRTRPIHTLLLGVGIPIVEHMTGLEQLPDAGFTFTAAPPKIRGLGSFPVRAFAEI